MSSDTPMGAGNFAVGAYMSGRPGLVVGKCCGHIHERVEGYEPHTLTWIAGCWCGCRADRNEYEGIEVECSPRRVADVVAAARTHDDDHDNGPLCPIHHLAGICAELGRSNAPAVRSLDEGRDLRRGWLDRFIGRRISRFIGDFGGQLVFPRRWR